MKQLRHQVIRQALGCLCLVLLCSGLWGCAESSATVERATAIATSNQWRSLQIEGFSIDIPPGFVAGLPGLELEGLQASLTELGFSERSTWLAQNAGNIDVLAFQPLDAGLNSINVVRSGRSPEETTMADYLALKVEQLKTVGVQVKSEVIATEPTVGVLQLREAGQTQVIYVFAGTDDFWVVTYSGRDGQFDENLIEQSRRSIEIPSESE